MKTAQLMLAVLVMVCVSAAARPLQDPMGGPHPGGPPPGEFGDSPGLPSPKGQLKRLTRLLKLNDEQQGKVQSILEEQKQRFEKLRQDQSDGDDPQAIRELQKETSAQIREVLDDEQKAKFDAYEKKQQQPREQRGGFVAPPPAHF
jgi:Spy/CpxP family protein refolding chaperone